MKMIRLCFVGIGSIAKRHITNLYKIFLNKDIQLEIDALRTSKTDLDTDISEKINQIYYNTQQLPYNYDAIFLTNPTRHHYTSLMNLKDRSKNFFIEKPVFDNENADIDSLRLPEGGIYYVACPLRYTKIIQYIKNSIALSEIYSIRSICSSYLPEWRPGIDYRKTYSSKKELGGGVSIDLIHEWDYLCYLFGRPQKVSHYIQKVSDLEIDSDDIAIYIARYKDKLVELHLDYFGRKPIRQLQLITREDTIIADLYEGTITYLKENYTVLLKEDRDQYQMKELEYFFDIIAGKQENSNTIETALTTLHLAYGQTDDAILKG